MMKRTILATILSCISTISVHAQQASFERGIFNTLGTHISVGTEGLGLGVATSLTPYVEVSAALNFMPSFKFSETVDIMADVNLIYNGITYTIPVQEINVKGSLARTTCDLKVSCYPFGEKSGFFVATGFSFGGSKLISVTGHSDDMEQFISNPNIPSGIKEQVYVELDKYKIHFDQRGNVNASLRVNGFRPYLGLGFGRQVPSNRVGYRFEMGCQFHGTAEIYQGNQKADIDDLKEHDDSFTDIIDKITVYPVIKLTLTGRIL
ncbi:MAG: hypothetical protein SPI30_05250 [Prevotella sp.]|nr:hypothetical protein [Prevotella sp.]